MTYSVYQHWDPLKVCIVGKSYPPEFYSWIKDSRVRKIFERIAIETEEDYQGLVRRLQDFGVKVFRPEIGEFSQYLMPDDSRYLPPPMTPRDICIMIGQRFYEYFIPTQSGFVNPYQKILENIQQQGNQTFHLDQAGAINGSSVTRMGKDLYFGTERYDQDQHQLKKIVTKEFPDYRTHVVNSGGHLDGSYCPVTPGLIVSVHDMPAYQQTYPDWEVVYLKGQGWDKISGWAQLKKQNFGKWWIPGFEKDQDLIETVEHWLSHWVGYVEETVFDVNMLIVDPKNVLVLSYNKIVFDALERYGITPHIVPFRHRYFWDGGLHCITADLDRLGTLQDFFPNRFDSNPNKDVT